MPPTVGLLYQPIPLPGFPDTPAERDSSQQRLELIQRQVDFQHKRVLDLGCANGFFLLSLHETISDGLGIDHFQGNIDTCNALVGAYELPNLTFRQGSISKTLVEELTAGPKIDVCILMSVHHHLVRDVGIEETKAIIGELASKCDVLVIEQGSLTQDEYSQWTDRDEVFLTNSYSRLISMLACCGIDESKCRPVGMGKYLSGLRPDEDGAGRAIVSIGGAVGIEWVLRKQHKNSVLMEVLQTSDGVVWKNVLQGPSLAEREAKSLEKVGGRFVPKLLAVQDHCLKLEARSVEPIPQAIRRVSKDIIRASCLEAVTHLASHGVVHNELHDEHLLWDHVQECAVIVDFETAWDVNEDRSAWLKDVATPNPSIGLGLYDSALLHKDPCGVDLVSLDVLFSTWGMEKLSAQEIRNYRNIIAEAVAE